MTAGRAFFDTNILLYMYGGGDRAKRAQAKDLFREHAQSDRVVVSTQVVQEFYAAGSRKLGMARRACREATAELLELPLVTVGPEHIRTALRIEERYRVLFWDALILAAAESGGAEMLYTEGLSDGQVYGTVTVRNPFRPQDAPAA